MLLLSAEATVEGKANTVRTDTTPRTIEDHKLFKL